MHVGARLGLIAGASPPVYEYLYSSSYGYNSASITFPSVPFGAALPDRKIVVGFHGFRLAAAAITSCTIGGVAATVHVEDTYTGGNGIQGYIVSANVPTGTSGDVVVNFSQTQYICGMNAHSIKGLTTDAPYIATYGTYESTSLSGLNIQANSVVIATSTSHDTSSAATTWTGLTERSDTNSYSRVNHSSAADVFLAANPSLTISFSGPASIHRIQAVAFK